jgi:hypothetical protein
VELVPILRLLSRRPILVAIGAVVAIAIGVLAAGGQTKKSGTASARLVLDTGRSQLIHQAPRGADTLPWRAVLLADLAGSRPLMDRIASQADIRRSELVVVHPDLAEPVLPATLPTRAAEVARVISEKYVLTVRFDEMLPIVSLGAEAPDRRAAVRLVAAAVDTLEDAGTPTEAAPQIQSLVVESAGPVRSRAIIDRPQPLLGVVLAIVLFGMWCAALAVIPRVLSAWRRFGPRPQPA